MRQQMMMDSHQAEQHLSSPVTKTCPAGFFYDSEVNQCRVCATKWGACDLCTSEGCFQCSFGTINNFLDEESKSCIRMCMHGGDCSTCWLIITLPWMGYCRKVALE